VTVTTRWECDSNNQMGVWQ